VRASAGLQIRPFDFDRSQNPAALHFLAHPKLRQILRRSIPNSDRAVFENHLIRSPLRAFQNLLRRLRPANVNRANLPTQMKRHRGPPVALLKHRRQQMLAGMLLHVIEAPPPVDAAIHRAGSHRPIDHVHDLLSLIAHVQHVRLA